MSKVASKELTERQKQVAVAIALGKPYTQIAEELGVTIKTLDTHRQAVMKKLELRNNVELARYAIAVGWTPIENVEKMREALIELRNWMQSGQSNGVDISAGIAAAIATICERGLAGRDLLSRG